MIGDVPRPTRLSPAQRQRLFTLLRAELSAAAADLATRMPPEQVTALLAARLELLRSMRPTLDDGEDGRDDPVDPPRVGE